MQDLKAWLPVSSHSANIVQRNAFRGHSTKYKFLENFALYGTFFLHGYSCMYKTLFICSVFVHVCLCGVQVHTLLCTLCLYVVSQRVLSHIPVYAHFDCELVITPTPSPQLLHPSWFLLWTSVWSLLILPCSPALLTVFPDQSSPGSGWTMGLKSMSLQTPLYRLVTLL